MLENASMGVGTALFPISLSNQAFSSETVAPLLPDLFRRYDSILFLVADRLQIYNKALRLGRGLNLASLISDFDGDQHYLDQRTRWLSRITASIGEPASTFRWSIKGVEEFADAHCFKIFRNVMLAYYTLEDFKKDINATAREHALARDDIYPLSRREELSRGYILEEIAISIRIHVVDGIRDEFYLGSQAIPVLRLYGGSYGVSPEELAHSSPAGAKSRFYCRTATDKGADWAIASLSND